MPNINNIAVRNSQIFVSRSTKTKMANLPSVVCVCLALSFGLSFYNIQGPVSRKAQKLL